MNSLCALGVIHCTPNKFEFWSNARQNSFINRKNIFPSNNKIAYHASHTHISMIHATNINKSVRVYVIMIVFCVCWVCNVNVHKIIAQIYTNQIPAMAIKNGWKRITEALECWKYVKNEDKRKRHSNRNHKMTALLEKNNTNRVCPALRQECWYFLSSFSSFNLFASMFQSNDRSP